jgi:hypothetical protein
MRLMLAHGKGFLKTAFSYLLLVFSPQEFILHSIFQLRNHIYLFAIFNKYF